VRSVRRERVILGTASVFGVFVLWELSVRFGLIRSNFLVSPSEVLIAGIKEVQDPRFWRDLRVSLFEFFVGYLAAVVLGVSMGIVLGWYRRLSYLFEPLVNLLYAIPRIALLPVIILWLGLTVWSKVAVVFLGAFVTILVSTIQGVRTVEPSLLAVANVFGASQRQTFVSVVIPGSIPFILAGLRLGAGRALIGVVIGELYAANAGVGFMIVVASNNLQIDRVLFGTFVFIALGLLTVGAIRLVERRYATWRDDLSFSR
jgi:NitT/TauT family transport system permease protein